MPIEVVIGLPHLRAGPILSRAIALGVPTLISANCLSRWTSRRGWREWTGWDQRPLGNAQRLASLDLDSGGFVAMRRYGGIPWTVDRYMELATAFPFRRIASLDYCCEPEIACNRSEILDRIARTVRANHDCAQRAADLGLGDRLMPVLQGRVPTDYERCADQLAHHMVAGRIVGVGSLCRREIAGPEGLVAVVAHLDRVLPPGVRLHGFGVKGTALPYLKGLEHRIASIDSQAYGIAARIDAHRCRMPKTDMMVAAHLERWTRRQVAKTLEAKRSTPWTIATVRNDRPRDPWRRAILIAEEEIREAIRTGDIAHDDITALWVEPWAADIFNDPDRYAELGLV